MAEGIAAYAAAAGDHPFHFIARLYWPGMDASLMREALTVHAEQVIPAARDRAGRRRRGTDLMFSLGGASRELSGLGRTLATEP